MDPHWLAAYEERKACHDCGVQVGEVHLDGCDIAVCLWTGTQRIQCEKGLIAECCRVLRGANEEGLADELAYHHSLDDPDHDCGHNVWSGIWPGTEDCIAMDLWCYWGPDWGERGWVRCHKDHPGATPDLNRLIPFCEWDRSTHHWVPRKTGETP